MEIEKYLILCTVKNCGSHTPKISKRPHKEFCLFHWAEKYPEQFEKFVSKMTTRTPDGVKNEKRFKKEKHKKHKKERGKFVSY